MIPSNKYLALQDNRIREVVDWNMDSHTCGLFISFVHFFLSSVHMQGYLLT